VQILCHDLCHNLGIPAGISLRFYVSLGDGLEEASLRGTRMNTAS